MGTAFGVIDRTTARFREGYGSLGGVFRKRPVMGGAMRHRALKVAFLASVPFLLAGAQSPQPWSGPVRYAAQGWSDADRTNWYWTSQGSRLMPLTWMQALEQVGNTRPFLAADHIAGFGYFPDPTGTAGDGLPVGFAVDHGGDRHLVRTRLRWYAGQRPNEPWIGMSCAACHTAEVAHRGQRLRVDGAPTMADFQRFVEAVDQALLATRDDGAKWDRFARAVLAANDTPSNRLLLRGAFEQLLAGEQQIARMNGNPIRYGPARLDAFGHIYNKAALLSGAGPPGGKPVQRAGQLSLPVERAAARFRAVERLGRQSMAAAGPRQARHRRHRPQCRRSDRRVRRRRRPPAGTDRYPAVPVEPQPQQSGRCWRICSAGCSRRPGPKTCSAGSTAPAPRAGRCCSTSNVRAATRRSDAPTSTTPVYAAYGLVRGRRAAAPPRQQQRSAGHRPADGLQRLLLQRRQRPAGADIRTAAMSSASVRPGRQPAHRHGAATRWPATGGNCCLSPATSSSASNLNPRRRRWRRGPARPRTWSSQARRRPRPTGTVSGPPAKLSACAWSGGGAATTTASWATRRGRLTGIWATAPFLHNGSVPTLYDLLLPPA